MIPRIGGLVLLVLVVAVLGIKYFNHIPKKPAEGEQAQTEHQVGLPDTVVWSVPFTPQAPLGNWTDIKQGNGCEEASILMAYSWAKNTTLSPELAAKTIIQLSDFAYTTLGHFHDISNQDTLKVLTEYFSFSNAHLESAVSLESIKTTLVNGKIVIVAVNGDKLTNPHYQIPKPANHKLVIIGFDERTQEFVTNDPGTSQGAGYRYSYDLLLGAITDYPTGYRESYDQVAPSMLVVAKEH